MEPFFLRCETCQARLRVRDERFLGQVQSCPKCGSMVQIVAPAGWLAAGEVEPTPTETAIIAPAESPTTIAQVLGTIRQHTLVWSAGGAALLVAGGLVGMLFFGGKDEVAALPTNASVAEASVDAPSADILQAAAPMIEEVSIEEEIPEEVATASPAPSAFLPLEAPVATEPESTPTKTTPPQTASEPIETRTLTLEAIELEPLAETGGNLESGSSADYPPVADAEAGTNAAQPPEAERPARVTNVVDQLSVPIESIELPAMPIGEFVHMISEMSAVPIRLDPKVLGDVGLSSRTKVIVKGGDITLGKLLARVLKEHQLTCVERDGELVVVKAKRQAD